MNVLLTIKSLYALNGIIASLLYLPQVARAWRDAGHGETLSPVTFGGWCIGSLITALYAWMVSKDHMFTAVSLGNMAGSGTIFLLVTFRRFKHAYRQGTKRTVARVSLNSSCKEAST